MIKLYFALDVETTGLNYDGASFQPINYYRLHIKF